MIIISMKEATHYVRSSFALLVAVATVSILLLLYCTDQQRSEVNGSLCFSFRDGILQDSTRPKRPGRPRIFWSEASLKLFACLLAHTPCLPVLSLFFCRCRRFPARCCEAGNEKDASVRYVQYTVELRIDLYVTP